MTKKIPTVFQPVSESFRLHHAVVTFGHGWEPGFEIPSPTPESGQDVSAENKGPGSGGGSAVQSADQTAGASAHTVQAGTRTQTPASCRHSPCPAPCL